MSIYEQNGRWYFKLQIRGKRFNRAIPEAVTKKDAEHAEAIFKSELLQNRFNLADRKGEKLFFDLVKDFELYAKTNRIRWKNDMYAVNKFKTFFGNKRIKEITPFYIEKYRALRRDLGIKNSSINKETGVLRRMFSLAVDNQYINENPCIAKKVKPLREDNKKERFLTPDEEVRMLHACTGNYNYLKSIIICALQTGMRKAEILNLEWDNIDLQERYLTLLKTKNGKTRRIPLNNTLLREFQKLYLTRTSKYVFINPETSCPYVSIIKSFNKICKIADVKNFVFHDLRHTAATRMVSVGIDLAVVKEILGHSSITTTMRYSHPVPERKLQAVEALERFSADRSNVVNSFIEKRQQLQDGCG